MTKITEIIEQIKNFKEKLAYRPDFGDSIEFITSTWKYTDKTNTFSFLPYNYNTTATLAEKQENHNEAIAIKTNIEHEVVDFTKSCDFKSQWDKLEINIKKELLTFSLLSFALIRKELTYSEIESPVCGVRGKNFYEATYIYRTLVNTKNNKDNIEQKFKDAYGLDYCSSNMEKIKQIVQLTYPNIDLTTDMPAIDYVWLYEVQKLSPEAAKSVKTPTEVFLSFDLLNELENQLWNKHLILVRTIHVSNPDLLWKQFVAQQEPHYLEQVRPYIEKTQLENVINATNITKKEFTPTYKI